jgi:hypothetical protein
MKTVIQPILLGLVLFAVSNSPSVAQDWWSVPDKDFVAGYGNLAKGTQTEQSRFAWMMFARVNQQVTFSGDQKKYSQWELWPSDLDTFSPNVPSFVAANKIRRVPHLQVSRLALMLPDARRAFAGPLPASEEVTRNPIAYEYIRSNGLHTLDGIADYLAIPRNEVDFPSGAIEIKAAWDRASLAGAYQVSGYSLIGLHVMVKFAPRPADAFKDNAPSWFWATFELKSNGGLANARRLITHRDALPGNEAAALLAQAGLSGTAFANYVSMGQQIQFSDTRHKAIVLGNTKIEGFLGRPPGDPSTWTSWQSSCHSCHAQAAARRTGSTAELFRFTSPVGPLTGSAVPPPGYKSLDFVWAFLAAR